MVSTARHDLTKDCAAAQVVGMRARETQELLKSCGLNYVCTFEKKKPVFHKI